jgi:hypothetical protein
VGSVKNGKIKIENKQTGQTSWRSANQGLVKDPSGNPSAATPKPIDKDLKPTHSVHTGRTNKTFKKVGGK